MDNYDTSETKKRVGHFQIIAQRRRGAVVSCRKTRRALRNWLGYACNMAWGGEIEHDSSSCHLTPPTPGRFLGCHPSLERARGGGIESPCVEDVPLWTSEGDAGPQGEPWRRSEIAKKEVAVFRKKAKRKNNSPLGKKSYMRASVFAADWLFVYFRQSAILKSAYKNFLV